ncbi:hypothetical protein F2Q69_00040587 [Brassica cretica]|uniref:Uncharacterized protein n=1 Tax=Brassica cretica TaxID=69181 RepID=A0A8S9NLW0_BRACR|nr:hypothetical protein F2Q69_00040587 [Brassica cretica]
MSTALRFDNFIWLSLPSLFSHLVAVFIVACWAWKVVSGIKLELWFFGGWLPFSLPQSMWFFAGMGALPVHN